MGNYLRKIDDAQWLKIKKTQTKFVAICRLFVVKKDFGNRIPLLSFSQEKIYCNEVDISNQEFLQIFL